MKPARIVILVIAIVAGGIAALLAGRSEPPSIPAPVAQIETGEVLVANSDIGPGHAVSPQELRWQLWPAESIGPHFIRRSDQPNAIEQLAGSITRQQFSNGEPIREARLIKAQGSGFMAAILPSGMRAVSIEVATESTAGGFILPNDRVDVVLSLRRDKDSEKAVGPNTYTTETIISNVRVLAVDQQIEEKSGQRAIAGAKTVTLEISPRQAELLAKARQIITTGGTLSLALRSLLDADQNQMLAVDDDKGPRGLNVVRFGSWTVINSK